MLARIGLFIAVLVAGAWVYLTMFTSSDKYFADLKSDLQQAFAAEEIEIGGFRRLQGEFQIGKMAMIGGENTFFSDLEVMNLKCQMGLLDSFAETWEPGLIEIDRAEISLRAGSDSEESSKAIADVLFYQPKSVKIEAILVANATLRWGYSKRTRGRIVGSEMRARKIDGGWRLIFKGGRFSQNWLKELEINELIVSVGRSGLVFEKADLKKGEGSILFTGLEVESGQRPKISGNLILRRMDLADLLPENAQEIVEGRISGEFDVMGSTNSIDGVGFEGKVELAGEDEILLRDQIPLLRALSVVDALNNYKRVSFREGSFYLKSYNGTVELSQIDLKAEDLLTLTGNVSARAPTTQEMLEMAEKEDVSATILTDDKAEAKDAQFTLKDAATEQQKDKEANLDKEDKSIFDRLGLNEETRRAESEEVELQLRSYRYQGQLLATLKKDAFARAPLLAVEYPVNESSRRIPFEIPIEGLLFELTADQAEEVYVKGTR
ncbi:MAG: hypothetical protein AB8D78_01135 [Akkermansiaceae bacterium]